MSGTATVAGALCETTGVASFSHGSARPIRLCHFTTAHSLPKSRSFHRQCLPLAQAGVDVRYVGPFKHDDPCEVGFVSVPCRKGRARRALTNMTFVRELLRQDADLYHFQDPELLPLAFALKTVFRKRVIYDAYEDFPSMARAGARIPPPVRPIAGRLIEVLEWMATRSLDGVTTADPLTLRRLARSGVSRKLVFHNFPNLKFFPPPRPTQAKFDLIYRGGISERAGTFVLLQSLRALAERSRKVRTLLLGYFDSSAAEEHIRNCIRELGLESIVDISGSIDHADMAAALSQARIGVCPLQPTPKFMLNIPVKVFEYWACGLPVIASDLPPIRPYFRVANAGLLFEPGNAIALARSIEWMLDHAQAAIQFGVNGRAAVTERFNNDIEVRRLLRFCTQLTTQQVVAQELLAHA